MNMVTALNTSALAHCNYNAANAKNQTCTSDPHGEMMSCTGFTGATAQGRRSERRVDLHDRCAAPIRNLIRGAC
jgi:hypothetical protein